jgi:hypothetical protein
VEQRRRAQIGPHENDPAMLLTASLENSTVFLFSLILSMIPGDQKTTVPAPPFYRKGNWSSV